MPLSIDDHPHTTATMITSKHIAAAILVLASQLTFAQKSRLDCEKELDTQDSLKVARCIFEAAMPGHQWSSNEPAGSQAAPKSPAQQYLVSDFLISDIDSAGGVEVSLYLNNIFDKPIKYVNVRARAFNAVKDDVSFDAIQRRGSVLLQVTGPLEPNDGGRQYWERVWYSPTAKCVSIERIEVTLMNNQKINLAANDKRLSNNKCR